MKHSALLALLLGLLACQAQPVERSFNASGGAKLEHVGTQASSLVFGLREREGFVRARGLLRQGALPISGAVREVGYFYATIGLGTPTRTFDLIIDTGSTISYVPCKDCRHCGKHKDAAFDVAASSTATRLGCGVLLCNCGSPPCQCLEDKCYYSRSYAEMSSSAGFLIEDHFAFPDSKGPVRLVFGCEADETGEIFRQQADGILGMGNNNNAFQSQLVEQRVIENTFGLCFGHPNGGTMILGHKPVANQAQMKYTPLKPGAQVHYYTVITEAITVDGVKVNVPASLYAVGYGSVVDSGTTFTYIPSAAFQGLMQLVDAAATAKGLKRTPGSDPAYNDVCWKGAPDNALATVFPKVAFVFEPNIEVNMAPMQYLFKMSSGSYCLGIFDNGRSGTLIGGISVRGVLVQYDRRNHRIGFLEGVDCNNLEFEPERSPVASPTPKPKTTPRVHHVPKRSPHPVSTQLHPGQQQQQQQQQQEQQQQQGAGNGGSGVPAGEQGQSAAGMTSPDTVQGGEMGGEDSEQGVEDGFELVDGDEAQDEGQAGGQHRDGDLAVTPVNQQQQPPGSLGDTGIGGGSGTGAGAGSGQGAWNTGAVRGAVGPGTSGAGPVGVDSVARAVVGMVVVVVAIQLAYTYRQALYVWYASGYQRLVQLPELVRQAPQNPGTGGATAADAVQRSDLP